MFRFAVKKRDCLPVRQLGLFGIVEDRVYMYLRYRQFVSALPPGSIVTELLRPRINEENWLLSEEVVYRWDIDAPRTFGHAKELIEQVFSVHPVWVELPGGTC